jgi:hypothetical protein
MPLLGFESTTPVFERAQTVRTLDREAAVNGNVNLHLSENLRSTVWYDHSMLIL